MCQEANADPLSVSPSSLLGMWKSCLSTSLFSPNSHPLSFPESKAVLTSMSHDDTARTQNWKSRICVAVSAVLLVAQPCESYLLSQRITRGFGALHLLRIKKVPNTEAGTFKTSINAGLALPFNIHTEPQKTHTQRKRIILSTCDPYTCIKLAQLKIRVHW